MSIQPTAPTRTISIIVPVFNEETNLSVLVERVAKALASSKEKWSLLFIDDGSRDGTFARLRKLVDADPRIGAISLSRNFGKEAAIAAGLKHARGDAVVIMDADFQHPPEVIPLFLAAWRDGYDVVFGLRQDRVGESRSRTGLSKLFYRAFRRFSDINIPEGATDFVLLDRKAVGAMNSLDERCRFTKGLFSWIGFRSTGVPFAVGARQNGLSRWSLIKLATYAGDAFASFSSMPLKVWSYIGMAVSIVAIAYALYFAAQTMIFGVDVPGFPSLIISIMFFAGVQLISLGVMGEYLARLFQEVKQRPIYIIAERFGHADTKLDARD